MVGIAKIGIAGFKSIKDSSFELSPLNVLIGANGAGKSNFISVLEVLRHLSIKRLQFYINYSGGAEAILHYGGKKTNKCSIEVELKSEIDCVHYNICLSNATPDKLLVESEKFSYVSESKKNNDETIKKMEDVNGKESSLLNINEPESHLTQKISMFRKFLKNIQVFQFNDTSDTARIRKNAEIFRTDELERDAGNLAAVLYVLEEHKKEYYDRIVSSIRLAAPHFDDFALEPSKYNSKYIMLNWRERGSSYLFGPHQISDGLLRFMALTTLLKLPDEVMPSVIVIDEPELGLHPWAVNILGGMIKKASKHCQVIVATQSINLVDQFMPEDIVIVNRKKGITEFSRLNETELNEWLEEYSLSELWEKNVLGGEPER